MAYNPVADVAPLLIMPALTHVDLTGVELSQAARQLQVSALEAAGVVVSVGTLSGPVAAEGLLAFTGNLTGTFFDIFAIDLVGGTVARLVHLSSSHHWDPAWSPDWTKLAYVTSGGGDADLYVAKADGSDAVRLTSGPDEDAGPAWSPDGTRIAYASRAPGGSADLYVVALDGSKPVNLTEHPGDDRGPTWSPGGDRIAFSSDRDGSPAVYTMATNGSDVVRLTRSGEEEADPTWSPDGSLIAFSRAWSTATST